MSIKSFAAKLFELRTLTSTDDFQKTPRGYQLRERAALVQLCLHPNPVVRMAAAELPVLRDMFIVAMFEQESNADVKAVLEPRYLEAISKEDERQAELEAKDSEIASLKEQLQKALARKK